MDGLRFVRGDYLRVRDGIFLPSATIAEQIWVHLVEHTPNSLQRYVPDLMKSDFFFGYDQEHSFFAIFISKGCRRQLPTWGSDKAFFKQYLEKGMKILEEGQECIEITGTPLANTYFQKLDFDPGPAIMCRFPFGYDENSKKEQLRLTFLAAQIVWAWAERERVALENSKIFLSHKGVNKPLVQRIDHALTMLNLRPWLDKHDLPVGDPLVRGVDQAFADCAAAVFFISGEYVDQGVIAQEIDRALHESALRPSGFKIIPLVLRQHGGADHNVPAPLQKLKWETVDDIDILPTILRSLPAPVQSLIKYAPVRG